MARPFTLPRHASELPVVVGIVIVYRLLRVAAECLLREVAQEASMNLRRPKERRSDPRSSP